MKSIILLKPLLQLFDLDNEDFVLNLISEGIGILFSFIIISPFISFIVTKKQARIQQIERIKMAEPLNKSFHPINNLLLSVKNGSDADLIAAGFEMVRRNFNYEIKVDRSIPNYDLALGNPEYIIYTIKQRMETQVRYINSLIDLFAPHFRTKDASMAVEYLENLRMPIENLNFILQKIQWILSSANTYEQIITQHLSIKVSSETGGNEDAELRISFIRQMQENIKSTLNETLDKYHALENMAKKLEKSFNNFVNSLENTK